MIRNRLTVTAAMLLGTSLMASGLSVPPIPVEEVFSDAEIIAEVVVKDSRVEVRDGLFHGGAWTATDVEVIEGFQNAEKGQIITLWTKGGLNPKTGRFEQMGGISPPEVGQRMIIPINANNGHSYSPTPIGDLGIYKIIRKGDEDVVIVPNTAARGQDGGKETPLACEHTRGECRGDHSSSGTPHHYGEHILAARGFTVSWVEHPDYGLIPHYSLAPGEAKAAPDIVPPWDDDEPPYDGELAASMEEGALSDGRPEDAMAISTFSLLTGGKACSMLPADQMRAFVRALVYQLNPNEP